MCRRVHRILGNGGHAPHYRGLGWIAHLLRLSLGLLAGHENQPTIQHFAPSANVMFAQLHKKDRPIMVTMPTDREYFFLVGIDAHERS